MEEGQLKFKAGDIRLCIVNGTVNIIIIKDCKIGADSKSLGKSYGGTFNFYNVEYTDFNKLTMWELARYIDNFYKLIDSKDLEWVRLLYG